MFDSIINFFKRITKKETSNTSSRDTAKERLHLVLMQDRANVSADFLDLMRQEIIEVIKKYIDIDEDAMDVRLTNQENEDGTQGAPALYANIPIINIKEKSRRVNNEIKGKKKIDNEVDAKENKTENKKSKDDKEVKIELKNIENTDENEIDSETKEVTEKAKKIVEEENSSHNKENEKKEEQNDSESKKIDKKESENE